MAAITAGDHETGVALMVMDAGIDTGAVISQERALVADDDTSESLGGRLARIGAELAVRDIPRWVEGDLVASRQQGSQASLTRTLTKADGWIDWTRPAADIERQIRAMWPWPRAWTTHPRITDPDPSGNGCRRRKRHERPWERCFGATEIDRGLR